MRYCYRLLVFVLCGLCFTCSGGGGSGDSSTNANLFTYAEVTGLYRVGEAVSNNTPTISNVRSYDLFAVSPTLPAGLNMDSATGVISGTPNQETVQANYTITASNSTSANSSISTTLQIVVGPQLPGEFAFMEPGFSAEKLLDMNAPVRMAFASDGRLFVNELTSGQIRILDQNNNLLATPFANLTIVSGNERGLLGLTLDPDFATNGFVYVSACVPGPDRVQIIRLTEVNNIGVNQTVLVDNLPISNTHNGGELVFDLQGNLFLGRGDVQNENNSQTDGALAGKVLRYTKDGGIPADNPILGDPEWVRGIRNTFAMTLHPATGDLFGADVGPTNDDELNYLVAGKNFEWGLQTEPQGSVIGFKIRNWREVITPTGLFFHSGMGGWGDYQNQIFLSSYNFEDIRRLEITGSAFTDVLREVDFARFNSSGIDNKPLCVREAPDGSIYVSTFTSIYRIFKFF